MKKDYGITLITLVISIVILLIILSISINALIGEKGIFSSATNATKIAQENTIKEELRLIWNARLKKFYEDLDKGKITPENISEYFSKNYLNSQLSENSQISFILYDNITKKFSLVYISNEQKYSIVIDIDGKIQSIAIVENENLTDEEIATNILIPEKPTDPPTNENTSDVIPDNSIDEDYNAEEVENIEEILAAIEKIAGKIGYYDINGNPVTIDWSTTNFDVATDYTKETYSTGDSAYNLLQKYPEISFIVLSKKTSIGNYAFYNCKNLRYLEIPSYYTSCTSIGEYAFSNTGLIRVKFPNSITTIGRDAFSYSKSLMNIAIPPNLETIPYEAFNYCSNLTKVEIPRKVTTISSWAFAHCKNLSEVIFLQTSSLNYIGSYAFYSCNKLENINFPSSLTGFSSYTFYNCTSLKEISIPHLVKSISNNCFHNCTSLENVSLSSVSYLGDNAFYNCTNLKEIRLTYGSKIGASCFSNCTNLTSIIIPSSSTVGANAFSNCTNLIKVSSYASKFSTSVFSNCTNLTEANLYNLSTLESSTFSNCTNLEKINLPTTLSTINGGAFLNCTKLKEVTIPKYVKTVKYQPFSGCTSLEQIILTSSNNPTYKSTWTNVSTTKIIKNY